MDAAALVLAAARRPQLSGADEPDAWRDSAILFALERALGSGDLDAVRTLAENYDTLLLRAPRRVDGDVVLAVAGNSERRHRGAFSTPAPMAAALARRALPMPLGGTVAGVTPTVVDPACGSGALLRAALARLLDLGVAPAAAARSLHGVDADPVAAALSRAVLAVDLTAAGYPCAPQALARQVVVADALLEPPGGLDWAAAFPAVLARAGHPEEPVTRWRGGFDVVIANPPWERLKVQARDWDGKVPARLRELRAATARAVREGGRHPLTGTGELNAYLPFVETCWRLLAPSGRASILVPAGITSDRSAARLLQALLEGGALQSLHLVEPDAPLFFGVSARIGVAIVDLHGGAHPCAQQSAAAEVAIGLAGPDDRTAGRAWSLDSTLLRLVNPNTRTAPLFGSAVDARIVAAVHRRVGVLVRRDPDTGTVLDDPWSLRLVTPLHMTRDAPSFRASPGRDLLPLMEAKHVGLLDPRGGGTAGPRHWVPEALVRARFGELCDRGWLAGYRNVATSSGPRTLVPSPLPIAGVGNSLPLISAPQLPLLLAALASLPVDYLIRQKHAGANLNFFKLEQIPVPPPTAYDVPAPWDPAMTIGRWVLTRFARAVTWMPGLTALEAELRQQGIDVQADRSPDAPERLLALADLDAAHAILLGLDRSEMAHILGTFGALRDREMAAVRRFASADRVLAAYDRLTTTTTTTTTPPSAA